MTSADVTRYLREQFAFVEASSRVWKAYTRTFVSWLRHLRFVRTDRSGRISIASEGRDELITALGNLAIAKRGARPRDAAFVPSRRLSVYLSILARLETEPIKYCGGTRTESFVLRELQAIGAVRIAPDHTVARIMDGEMFVGTCRQMMIQQPYTGFWELVRRSTPYDEGDSTSLPTWRSISCQPTGLGRDAGQLGQATWIPGAAVAITKANDSIYEIGEYVSQVCSMI